MKVSFVIEHLESGLEKWASLEYVHICEIAGDDRVIFTKWPKGIANIDVSGRTKHQPKLRQESIDDLRAEFQWDRTCLLDMEAPECLAPEDAERFDTVVLGGILGNVPSDDRTREIRAFEFVHRRNLGPLQMTTNTAVLVSKIILDEKVKLDSIPLVHPLTLKLTPVEEVELPFAFVATKYFESHKTALDRPPQLSDDSGVSDTSTTAVLPRGLIDFLKASEDMAEF